MNNIALFESFVGLYIFLIGLCIGSFLNVVILRGLSGENFIFARSKCPKCGKQLKWYMNIPLISYIFLKGKCAYCNERISIQYPIVELTTGIAFLVSFLAFGLTLKTLFICIFLSLFIALAATDFLETVIIDYHAYILFGCAILYSFLNLGQINIIQSVLGGIGGFILFEALARLGKLIAKYRAFGEGDSLIALGLGGIFGFKNFLIVALISILIQAICAIPILAYRAYSKNKKLALSYILVFISMFIIFFLNSFNGYELGLIYYLIVIVLTLLLLWSMKNILVEIKNKAMDNSLENFDEAKETFNLMPFGPAMIFSGILCLFFIEQIKIAIKMFLY